MSGANSRTTITLLGEAEQRRMLRTKLIRIRVREFAFRTTIFIQVREDVVLPRLEGRAWVQKRGRICAGLHSRSVALSSIDIKLHPKLRKNMALG